MKYLKLKPCRLKYSKIFLFFLLGLGLLPFFVTAQETNNFVCQVKAPIGDYCFDSFNQIFRTISYVAIIFGSLILLIGILYRDSENILSNLKKIILKDKPIKKKHIDSIQISLLKAIEVEINSRLSQSLYELNKIELQVEDYFNHTNSNSLKKSKLDNNPTLWNRFLMIFSRKKSKNKHLINQKLIHILSREDVKSRLLILGEPGSGKTTELLQLASDLIDEYYINKEAPIPIIFELSSWKGKNISFNSWLIKYIKDYYSISENIIQYLLANNKIFPLFDGLDELGADHQDICIRSINSWVKNKQPKNLVVCCRLEEYENSEAQLLSLNHAIYLEPLSEKSIEQYLKKINRLDILSKLNNSNRLKDLARKPLFLTLLILVDKEKDIQTSASLLDSYISRQLYKKSKLNQISTEPFKVLHYLQWLSRILEKEKNTDFLIEKIQPRWLNSNKKIAYILLFISVISLIYSTFFSIFIGFQSGAIFGFSYSIFFSCISLAGFRKKDFFSDLPLLNSYIINWNLFNYIFLASIIISTVIAIILKTTEGVMSILITALGLSLSFGLFFSILFSYSLGIIPDNKIPEIGKTPNQGIWTTFNNTISLILLVSLTGTPMSILIIGINSKLNWIYTPLKHIILRIIYFFNGDIPWNISSFLAYARDLGFIQQVGGRYRFTHDLLRKHFASMRDYQNILN